MNKQTILEQVRWELGCLERLEYLARELYAVPEAARRPWDAAAAAKYISDMFRGLENLCKRKSRYLSEPFPEGPDSHAQILKDFLGPEGPGHTLDPEIVHRLRLYKGFRHRFIHGYGFELDWEVVEEPLRLLPETIDALRVTWNLWLDSLP
ncbi:MAG TPA: hypothetical protein PKO23_17905 [Candidatus Hydrogenedentes bacterium]|nr:hypothetical protein [Candidatus Hydrogenedentota bacterium]